MVMMIINDGYNDNNDNYQCDPMCLAKYDLRQISKCALCLGQLTENWKQFFCKAHVPPQVKNPCLHKRHLQVRSGAHVLPKAVHL